MRMDAGKKSDVIRYLGAAVRPTKYVGLFPLVEYRGQFYLKKTLLLPTLLVQSTYLFLAVYNFLYDSTMRHEEVKFNKAINFIQATCMYLATIVSVLVLLTSQGVLNESIQTLLDIEALLDDLGCPMVRQVNNRIAWLEVIFFFGAIVFRIPRNLLQGVNMQDTFVMTFYWMCLMISITTLVHRFTGILDICRLFLTSCNQVMMNASKYLDNKAVRLNTYLSVHSRLCRVSKSYSSIEMPQILLVLLCSFIISVSEFYQVLSVLAFSHTPYKFLSVVVKISWIALASTLIWRIVSTCWICSQQAKQFNLLIFQLMISDRMNGICSNGKVRLHIAMKQELVFTGCGLFILDYSLIHSMAAAATTYLVILLQLGEVGT